MPSDQQLIDNLGDHRGAFQELVRMLKQDRRLRAISLDSTDPALPVAGITDARFERYRKLMRNAGIDEDIQRERDGQGSISFRVAYKGGALTSDDRGYVYSAKPLAPLVGSLDGHKAIARTAYRHIGGNWYLYRWIDP
jgi:hypothetical protein